MFTIYFSFQYINVTYFEGKLDMNNKQAMKRELEGARDLDEEDVVDE